MKTLIWLLVTAAGLSTGHCQDREIDSLRTLLDGPDKENTIDSRTINSRLGWLFYSQHGYDSAIYYYTRALTPQPEHPNFSWLGNVHFGIGASYASLSKSDSSLTYLNRALGYFLSITDDDNIANTNINLAVVYKNLGLYEKAMEAAYSAAKILEKKGATSSLASCYNAIGSILAKTGDYDEAAKYYREAIGLFARFSPAHQARCYNNLGEFFIIVKQYDSARDNLLHSIKIKHDLGDVNGEAKTQSRLGKVNVLTGNLSLAEEQLKESLAIQNQFSDPIGMIEVLDNLGELYLVTHQYNQARLALDGAEKIIRKQGTSEHLKQNLELQVRLASGTKDYLNGMMLLEQLLVTRDSLLNEEKTRSLQGMRILYETEKKEQQIALLQQREEFNQAKIRNNQVVIASLVVGLLLIGTIVILISINLKNARASKDKIELLLAETRHRIKNNLQTLASIFHLQTRHYTDENMVLEARSSESRVHTMSLLHERFYMAEPGNTIRTRDYITDLVHKLVDIYGVRTNNLVLNTNIDDIELDVDKALALSLIIQEVICNAFKYAFDHEPTPVLSVVVSSSENHLSTIINDNGIGLSNTSRTMSQGLGLVDALVQQLDGKMQVSNDGGTTFTVTFPINLSWKKRSS